jgi:hypothetical protein
MIFTPPPYNPQSSLISDSDSCQTQATLHVLEMLQGNKQRWSPRALATLSGIKAGEGGTIQQVVNAINKYGVIPYDLWPDLTDNWTAEEYYTPIPQSIINQANKSYQVAVTAPDLTKSPLLVEIQVSPTMAHLMAQFNNAQVFDSYLPSVKPLTMWQPSAIVGKWGLKLTQTKMTFGYKVSDPILPGDQTVYIQAGNSFVPLADWQAFLNLGGSEASIVSITQAQLNAVSVVYNDLFKTNS